MTLPQRPLRGSRISTFYPVKSLPSLASLDSAFQLQEYISLLIRLDVHDVETIVSLPGKRAGKEKEIDALKDHVEDAEEKGKNDATVDEACWIYEQLRRLAQDLTHPLITMLQQECTRASCPEMKAGEWLYLCVAHGTDGNVEQCCAIDYILHTLDSATALLNTPRAFPSRIQIPQSSHRHFSSLARRLGRIFAHAYFHHREVFEQAEAESSLYARFLALTAKFDLVPAEFLVIPTPSSSGFDSEDSDNENDLPRDVKVPGQASRLMAAAPRFSGESQSQSHFQAQHQFLAERRGSVIPIPAEHIIAKSPSPPALAQVQTNGSGNGHNNGRGSESPRKLGRNRTDTMVLHEAHAVAEELAKAGSQPLESEPASISLVELPASESGRDFELENESESMSPMDVEELPKTDASPEESLEEIGSSLPESPTLHSPSLPHLSVVEADTEAAEPPKDTSKLRLPLAIASAPPVESSESQPVVSPVPVKEDEGPTEAPTPHPVDDAGGIEAVEQKEAEETPAAEIPNEELGKVDDVEVGHIEEKDSDSAREAQVEKPEEEGEGEQKEVDEKLVEGVVDHATDPELESADVPVPATSSS
ncbi:hypothetical protein H0H93_014982 [Arthromyces matolae]|nr:hypothetical protein H0H93_014982 [Arthromyces matolae]